MAFSIHLLYYLTHQPDASIDHQEGTMVLYFLWYETHLPCKCCHCGKQIEERWGLKMHSGWTFPPLPPFSGPYSRGWKAAGVRARAPASGFDLYGRSPSSPARRVKHYSSLARRVELYSFSPCSKSRLYSTNCALQISWADYLRLTVVRVELKSYHREQLQFLPPSSLFI